MPPSTSVEELRLNRFSPWKLGSLPFPSTALQIQSPPRGRWRPASPSVRLALCPQGQMSRWFTASSKAPRKTGFGTSGNAFSHSAPRTGNPSSCTPKLLIPSFLTHTKHSGHRKTCHTFRRETKESTRDEESETGAPHQEAAASISCPGQNTPDTLSLLFYRELSSSLWDEIPTHSPSNQIRGHKRQNFSWD